jgi:hypothetical protein
MDEGQPGTPIDEPQDLTPTQVNPYFLLWMTTSGIHAIAANARASSNDNADANASVNEDISLGK